MTQQTAAKPITAPQLKRLQVLYRQYEAHSLDAGPTKAERLAWASKATRREIASFSDLTRDEAIRLIDGLQRALGSKVPSHTQPAPLSRRDRQKQGTEGRRDQVHAESTLAGPRELALIQADLTRLGWTEARLWAFLQSPRGPNRGVHRHPHARRRQPRSLGVEAPQTRSGHRPSELNDMPKLTPIPNQFALFELPAVTEVQTAPKLVMPFQPPECIDAKRAATILQVSTVTVLRMCGRGLLRHYSRSGKSGRKLIEYNSLVEYCDRLRTHNGISLARVPLNGRKRRRDDELLPFPIDQTIYVNSVAKTLDYSLTSVIKLIESGRLVAYQVSINMPGCAWRIYKPSFERYLASLEQTARHSSSLRQT